MLYDRAGSSRPLQFRLYQAAQVGRRAELFLQSSMIGAVATGVGLLAVAELHDRVARCSRRHRRNVAQVRAVQLARLRAVGQISKWLGPGLAACRERGASAESSLRARGRVATCDFRIVQKQHECSNELIMAMGSVG